MRASVLILAALLQPPLLADGQSLRGSPVERFRDDVARFAQDLEATAAVERGRARRLAYWSVAEAWRYAVPPALVFGVMMQETSRFNARAVSSAGALGLMQIMPEVWRPVLGPYFGHDLFDEATNIRYGVWILAHYLHRSNGDVVEALERYSGGARRYWEKVSGHVERAAPASCPSRSAVRCIVHPSRAFGR